MAVATRFPKLPKLVWIGFAAVFVAFAIGDSSIVELMALAVFGVLVLTTLHYPLVGLSLLIVMIISNLSPNLIYAFGAPSIAKLAVPGLLSLLAVRYFFWGDRPYIGWLSLWLLVGYVALTLFGTTYAVDWRLTLDNSFDLAKVVIVALIVLAFMQYQKGFETVVLSSVLTVTAICGMGFIQVLGVALPSGLAIFAHFNEFHGRFEGPINDANFLAIVLVFNVPLALFYFFQADRVYKYVFWGLAVALLVFGILVTESRGGILALVVALGVLFLQLSRVQKVSAIFVFVVLLTAASFFLGAEAFERLATLLKLVDTVQIDKSAEGRIASYKVAWELFITHPWGGVGSGNFNIHYQNVALEKGLIFRGEGRSAHSLYLEIMAENGLVGLIYFLTILFLAALGLISAYKFAKAHGQVRLALLFVAFGAGLSGYLTGMVLLHDAYPRFLWIVILLAVEAGRIAALRLGPIEEVPPPKPLTLRLSRGLRVG